MEQINLEPRFSTNEIPGKCIKCLAEHELNVWFKELLRAEVMDQELKEKYETLISFLRSPESKSLRDESEKYLAEGKEVKVKIYSEKGKVKYEIKLN